MKAAVKVLALMAVLGLVSYVMAADAPATPEATPPVKGRVTKIEKDGAQITVNTGTRQDPKETVLTTNDKTKVTVDGKEAKIADIKVRMAVEAEVKDGVATTIKATVPARRGGGGGGGGGAPAGGDAPKTN